MATSNRSPKTMCSQLLPNLPCQVLSTTPPPKSNNIFAYRLFAILLLVLTACGSARTIPTEVDLPTPEEVVPTQPAPAATVNGETIPTDIYAIHLAQYQAAQAQAGTLLATEGVEQIVLDDLIDRLLLAQAARAEGFVLDQAAIDQRLAAVIDQAGGQANFDAWLAAQGYTADQFRSELALEIEAGWMRTRITDAVPSSAEQVEARQILLTDAFQAERLLGQLQGGTPFEQVAANNDPQGWGYLGWFPRGYLLQPQIEEAAFALQPGEYSQIIETSLGFHLVEVLQRQAERPLTPQARLSLQMKALVDWLQTQRSQAAIERMLP